MNDDELNPEFVEKINRIKRKKVLKSMIFKKRYDLAEDDLELSK